MDGQPAAGQTQQVGDFVEAFETAWARDLEPDLAEFLPATDHPHYGDVLAALVRLDLCRCREQGRPRRLAEYQARFPTLSEGKAFRDLAAEEERLLREGAGAGEP